jgi:XRE family transcriptional regulator, regulator of sulfur utilization
MQRVRRSVTRDEVEQLREQLTKLVPQAQASLPELIRLMRQIVRKSQSEYAKLCGVAPRALADIEAGRGSPRVDTLEKLLKPFGYGIGVVAQRSGEDTHRRIRRVVSRAELNQILTRKIRQIKGYEDTKLAMKYVYPEPDDEGCNWSSDVTFNSGSAGMSPDATAQVGRIVRAVRQQYNVKE